MARKNNRKSINTIWIFCEGMTEKNYFQKFRVKQRIQFKIKVITSENHDALGLINHSINFKQNCRRDFLEGDKIYCVFDRDNNTEQQLQQAVKKAKEKDIEIIFSNPCFEYWILCHFGYFFQSFECQELLLKVKDCLKSYKKNDKDIYSKIEDKTKHAIENAKKVNNKYVQKKIGIVSRESNPSTRVGCLIERIFEFGEGRKE